MPNGLEATTEGELKGLCCRKVKTHRKHPSSAWFLIQAQENSQRGEHSIELVEAFGQGEYSSYHLREKPLNEPGGHYITSQSF